MRSVRSSAAKGEVIMDLRYLGFDQQGNTRAYRFDCIAKGQPTKHLTITADIRLFLVHHVGIQEGPTLCAQKLTADLRNNAEGMHALPTTALARWQGCGIWIGVVVHCWPVLR